ncbi:MAG: glutamate-5-semialdehyde dehydrogenase [Clostridia bacterium]|nr:glutamate-5-semialdehyde dehydrogenase [Clostridia bacterium]
MTELKLQAIEARKASRILAKAGTEQKNKALLAIAEALIKRQDEWLDANRTDMELARENGIRGALLDRLALNEKRILEIADAVKEVSLLPDPLSENEGSFTRPNGLKITKRRVPLGVIAIIYEARPNVTVDAAVLCLKSGNACILRGGKEAINSNRAVVQIMKDALMEAGLPSGCINLVQNTDRSTAQELMGLTGYIDVLIPRGGPGLIRSVTENSHVPVIRTGEGVCHVYVDRDADLELGAKVLHNAKCSRPSVCNAAECLLLHESVAGDFLKKTVPLLASSQVELRADEEIMTVIDALEAENEDLFSKTPVVPAAPEDWDTEFGDYILAIHMVHSYQEAVDFISEHGTEHSECIITDNYKTAMSFLDDIDAAAVYVNASTRFTDGGEFGLGVEIGISTQKLHARGPMGLKELTSIKYVVLGQGQIR